MNEQNLLYNEFIDDTLVEVCAMKTEVEALKMKYPSGSALRRRAIEGDFQLEQMLELFAQAKKLDMYIDEETTGRKLLETRFGKTVEELQKTEKRPPFIETTKQATASAAEKTLDVTFRALGAFGMWLGDVTSKRTR